MQQDRAQIPGWRKSPPPAPPRCPVCGTPYADGAVIYRDLWGRVAGCGACVTAQYA